jgi:hypothetical protein
MLSDSGLSSKAEQRYQLLAASRNLEVQGVVVGPFEVTIAFALLRGPTPHPSPSKSIFESPSKFRLETTINLEQRPLLGHSRTTHSNLDLI